MFDVQEREIPVALVAFLYFFFLITAYYVLKPIRESLALELGAKKIPYLTIVSLSSLVICNGVYSFLIGLLPRQTFIAICTRFFSACLLLFWFVFWKLIPQVPPTEAFDIQHPRVVAIVAYFTWVNLFALVSVSMFWSFMNDVFSVSQGKRLYTLIGYGGLIGGLTGGILTSILAEKLGTSQMFLFAAFLLEPTVWCMRFIHRKSGQLALEAGEYPSPGASSARTRVSSPHPLDGLKYTLASPLLGLMAIEMFIYTFSSSLFSFQINLLVEENLPSRDLRTAYWAGIYNMINGLSLLTQFLVTRFVFRFSIPVFGLALIPLIQVVGSSWLWLRPGLEAAAAFGVLRYALNYSTGKAVRELFYTPLSREEKYQGKGFIDTLMFRGGDGLASILLIQATHAERWNWGTGNWIDGTIIGMMAVSILVIRIIGKRFESLSRRTIPEG